MCWKGLVYTLPLTIMFIMSVRMARFRWHRKCWHFAGAAGRRLCPHLTEANSDIDEQVAMEANLGVALHYMHVHHPMPKRRENGAFNTEQQYECTALLLRRCPEGASEALCATS